MDSLMIFYPDPPSFTFKGRLIQFGPMGDTYGAALQVTGMSLVAGYGLELGRGASSCRSDGPGKASIRTWGAGFTGMKELQGVGEKCPQLDRAWWRLPAAACADGEAARADAEYETDAPSDLELT